MSDTNVYYSPEKLGLTKVDEADLDNEPYQFNIRAVWRHTSGVLYTAKDSGCSCPSPFEDYNRLEDLDRIAARQQVDEIIKEVAASSASREEKDAFAEKLDTAWREYWKNAHKRGGNMVGALLVANLALAGCGTTYAVSGPATLPTPTPSPCPTAAPGTYAAGGIVKATELCGVTVPAAPVRPIP
jgi:hypothetical protein